MRLVFAPWLLGALAGVWACDTRDFGRVLAPAPDTLPDGGGDAAGGQPVQCTTDAQCDDAVPCTQDRCLTGGFCLHRAQPSLCADDVFCNGVERCDLQLGCLPAAAPRSCSDGDPCTTDRCDEDMRLCLHTPRDLDGDGDQDGNCGGADCDDTDPLRGGSFRELCADRVDNDCDGEVDEGLAAPQGTPPGPDNCGATAHDTCDVPLDLGAGGSFTVSTLGAVSNYRLGCGSASHREVVTRLVLQESRDLTVRATSLDFLVSLSLRGECEDADSELECSSGRPAVLRRRAVPPGEYALLVSSGSGGDVGLQVSLEPPSAPPANQTCDAAQALPEGAIPGSFVDVEHDAQQLDCGSSVGGDLFYRVLLTEPANLQVVATSDTGAPLAVAVQSRCDDEQVLRCATASSGEPSVARVYDLPVGEYAVVVTAPSGFEGDFTLDVRRGPPTPPPPGDDCDHPQALPLDTVVAKTFGGLSNGLQACGGSDPDMVFEFELNERRDVGLRVDGQFRPVLLSDGVCGEQRVLGCTSSNAPRRMLRDLPVGRHRVALESDAATLVTIEAATFPPAQPQRVMDNDACALAPTIEGAGGVYLGTTLGLLNTFEGTPSVPGGCGQQQASDAAFLVPIAERSRVVARTDGSSFDTVLRLLQGTCGQPGPVELVCNDDGPSQETSSVLDRVLEPGSYLLVVDGRTSADEGEYLLDVWVDPQ